jgi:hypothetical protein
MRAQVACVKNAVQITDCVPDSLFRFCCVGHGCSCSATEIRELKRVITRTVARSICVS